MKFSNNINEVKRHINELDVSATYKYDNSYAIKEYYKIINEILK